jgi:hypothetical protein
MRAASNPQLTADLGRITRAQPRNYFSMTIEVCLSKVTARKRAKGPPKPQALPKRSWRLQNI